MQDDIRIYSELIRVKDLLKTIQKVSWDITQFDKKFPLEIADPADYPALLEAYKGMVGRVLSALPTDKKLNQKLNNNEEGLDKTS